MVVPFLINGSYCGAHNDNTNRNHLLRLHTNLKRGSEIEADVENPYVEVVS